METYQELADINPHISSYQIEASWHAGKVEAKRQAHLAKLREREALQKKREALQKKRDNIKAQFSPYDNKHIDLARQIKRISNDPKSFQHIQTTHAETDNYLIVRMKFRGKNSIGHLVINTHTAMYSFDGRVLGFFK